MKIYSQIIDVENWNRKEHYDFFSRMSNPYFGIVTEVDCTRAYKRSRETGISFFSIYLHSSISAVNSIKELKLRIVDGQIVLFETIHAGTTIGREDGTFGFAFIPFSLKLEPFNSALQEEIYAVKNSSGLRLNNDDLKKDLIRHSTIPWHSFTGLLHPINLDAKESVPKITFGKFNSRNNKKFLPISIEAHHGLVDGLHLAQYLTEFQKQLDK